MPHSEIELAPQHQALPTKTEFDMMLSMANAISKAEFVPKGLRGRPDATLAAIMFGREIGLPPMVAMSSVYIIDGHPTMSSHLLMAMIRRAGHKILETASTATRAYIKAQRTDGEIMAVEFTIEEAKTAGLSGKDNWKHYPADMCWARAVSRIYRRLFSDVAFGATMYTPEDFDVTDAEASVATVFSDEQIAETGVMMGLTEFVPKPANGKMGELVKKELLFKVMRERELPPWKECTEAQQQEAIEAARNVFVNAVNVLGIDPAVELTEDQARDIFNLVRDGTMPTEEVTEGQIVDSEATGTEETAPEGQDGDVVDAEVVEATASNPVDEALAEQRWTELVKLLSDNITLGTRDQIEHQTRRLYRLMGEVGLWDKDQLHVDLAALNPPREHYSDLGRKADFQRFGVEAQTRAKQAYFARSDA